MLEWKKLESLLDYEQPSKYIVKSTNYDDSYSTPVLTAGQTFILGYTDETEGVYHADKEHPVLIFDDFMTSFHWVDFDFKVKSSALKILKPKKDVDLRLVYFLMKEIKYEPKEHSRHWISVYSQFEIPIPSLAEQKRIVGILDTFTESIENLTMQLNERQKQYEYYREKLLTFE